MINFCRVSSFNSKTKNIMDATASLEPKFFEGEYSVMDNLLVREGANGAPNTIVKIETLGVKHIFGRYRWEGGIEKLGEPMWPTKCNCTGQGSDGEIHEELIRGDLCGFGCYNDQGVRLWACSCGVYRRWGHKCPDCHQDFYSH